MSSEIKTEKFTDMKKGDLFACRPDGALDGNVSLCGSITEVKGPGEFTFWVENGKWAGSVKDDKMLIHYTGATMDVHPDAFQKLTAMSRRDASHFYMGGVKGVGALIHAFENPEVEAKKAAEAFEKATQEARHGKALEFVDKVGLSASLDRYIETGEVPNILDDELEEDDDYPEP